MTRGTTRPDGCALPGTTLSVGHCNRWHAYQGRSTPVNRVLTSPPVLTAQQECTVPHQRSQHPRVTVVKGTTAQELTSNVIPSPASRVPVPGGVIGASSLSLWLLSGFQRLQRFQTVSGWLRLQRYVRPCIEPLPVRVPTRVLLPGWYPVW